MTDRSCIEGVYTKGTVRAVHWAVDPCMESRGVLVADDIEKVTCKRCLRRGSLAKCPRRPEEELPEGVRWDGTGIFSAESRARFKREQERKTEKKCT